MDRYFGVYLHEESPGAEVMRPSRLPVWFPASYDLDVPMEMYAYVKDFMTRYFTLLYDYSDEVARITDALCMYVFVY